MVEPHTDDMRQMLDDLAAADDLVLIEAWFEPLLLLALADLVFDEIMKDVALPIGVRVLLADAWRRACRSS